MTLWTTEEAAAWSPPEPLSPAEWADRYQVIPSKSGAMPGRFRLRRSPPMEEPLNMLAQPGVRVLTITGAAQTIKTTCALNYLAWKIDSQPGPALVVSATEADMKKGLFERRIKPMFEQNPRLRRYLSTYRKQLNQDVILLRNMIIQTGWSGSPSSVASSEQELVWLDEVDKYRTNREGHPAELAEERTATFPDTGKVIRTCTPTSASGFIWIDYDQKSDARRYWVPCPLCGHYQTLEWCIKDDRTEKIIGGIVYPPGVTPEQIRTRDLCRYRCRFCGGMLEERMKFQLMPLGFWLPKGYAPATAAIDPREIPELAAEYPSRDLNAWKKTIRGPVPTPTHVGYQLSRLYSLIKPWRDAVATWKEIQDRRLSLRTFIRNTLGLPSKDTKIETDETQFAVHCAGKHHLGTVPEPVIVLTGGIDVQLDHFFGQIWGWGYYGHAHVVWAGRLDSFEELIHRFIETEYPGPGHGSALPVSLAFIDVAYRKREIEDLCREYPDVLIPTMGAESALAPLRAYPIDKDQEGRSVPGSLMRWHWDKSYFMEELGKMVSPRSSGDARLHLCLDPDDDYLRQMTSWHAIEIENERTNEVSTRWVKKSANLADHLWFAACYNLCAAHMARWYYLVPDVEEDGPQPSKGSDHQADDLADRASRGDYRDWMQPGAYSDWMTPRP